MDWNRRRRRLSFISGVTVSGSAGVSGGGPNAVAAGNIRQQTAAVAMMIIFW